jgi:hypothetical protein
VFGIRLAARYGSCRLIDENSRGKEQNVGRDSSAHDKGVPGKVVAELMGHVNVDTTLKVYTQVLEASVRQAVARVGDELITIVHKPAGVSELTP